MMSLELAGGNDRALLERVRADLISLPQRLIAWVLLGVSFALAASSTASLGFGISQLFMNGASLAIVVLLIKWRTAIVPIFFGIVIVIAFLAPQLWPFVLLAALLAPIGAFLIFRGMRPRILLLRPFGEAKMTRALKRVVLRHLGVAGFVFTLSDRNYKPSTAIRVFSGDGPWAYLLGPVIRPSLRIATVFDQPTLRLLQSDLAGRRTLEAKSIYCGGQAFNIASTDANWKSCIDLLMRTCDAIVMDLSKVGEGSTWEIVELGNRGLLEQCIFIVQEQHSDWLERIREALPLGYQPQVHLYKSTGTFIDDSAFKAALRRQLTGKR